MTKRYFKATDGKFTIFRASESRAYRYGWMTIDQPHRRAPDGYYKRDGEAIPLDVSFTNTKRLGACPAIEIGKHEYQVLVAIKTARVEAWREERRAEGQTMFGSISPSDSWVRNDELPEALHLGPTA